ncbi:hypothetical protein WJX74_007186 [Apatococcus lobatus]|uniref:UBX domain-containing protein n=1 Tax=Apatococcus lobatus TaxID=904363 RepID=A0AAW1QWY3_9CHLO
MASTLVVWSEGKRVSVKVTPMAPLSKIVEEACKALKPPRDPLLCQLLVNKKQQDLATPVRFANLPSNAKLELLTGHQKRLGVQDIPAELSTPESSSQASQLSASNPTQSSSTASPGSSTQPSMPWLDNTNQNGHQSLPFGAGAVEADAHPSITTPAPSSSQAPQPSALPSASTSPSMQGVTSSQTAVSSLPAKPPSELPSLPAQPPSQPSAPSDNHTQSVQQSNHSKSASHAQPAQPAPPPSAAPRPAFQMGITNQAAGNGPDSTRHTDESQEQSGANVLGVDRPLHVFRRSQAIADPPPDDMHTAAEEPSDAFFELTQDDLHRMMAGFNRSSKAGDGQGLKTGKMREQEASQKAARLGPVPIRIHLPDNLILQASFQATDPLAALQSFVKACLLPTLPSWYLYTTPPKQVLKDLQPTLFQAGLVPAANVYLGISGPTVQARGASSQPVSSQEAPQNGHMTDREGMRQLLRPEVEAVMGTQPQWQPRNQPGRRDASYRSALSGDAKGKGKAAEAHPGLSSIGEEKARKGPKWLKLGAR